ncbi:uncharacterized protein PAC_05060 [Phialocephala subalpina]|uniref:2EXR domain-containing protein n=1 Tax=Phialocephala subalpina TaxID=576137 RepID=A0A1L7WQX7_9HELO|nr:uncharacterized protein PAC_05060 [Phialocephala subalpina]
MAQRQHVVQGTGSIKNEKHNIPTSVTSASITPLLPAQNIDEGSLVSDLVASEPEKEVEKQAYDKFTLFGKLPIELRLKIWDECMPGPRVIEVLWNEARGYYATIGTPAILHACTESRGHTLKEYTSMVVDQRVHSSDDDSDEAKSLLADGTVTNLPTIPFGAYINFDRDMVYFFIGAAGRTLYDAKVNWFLTNIDTNAISKLQHVAMDYPTTYDRLPRSIISRFHELGSLAIVARDNCMPWHFNVGPSRALYRPAIGTNQISGKDAVEVYRWNTSLERVTAFARCPSRCWGKLLKTAEPALRHSLVKNGAVETMVKNLEFPVLEIIRGEASK